MCCRNGVRSLCHKLPPSWARSDNKATRSEMRARFKRSSSAASKTCPCRALWVPTRRNGLHFVFLQQWKLHLFWTPRKHFHFLWLPCKKTHPEDLQRSHPVVLPQKPIQAAGWSSWGSCILFSYFLNLKPDTAIDKLPNEPRNWKDSLKYGSSTDQICSCLPKVQLTKQQLTKFPYP